MHRRLLAAAILVSIATGAAAEGYGPVTNAVAAKECSACHMAYLPKLMTEESWRLVFADLSNHFGNDASLPEATMKEVFDYYLANASGHAPGRITDAKWWIRTHKKITDAKWIEVKFKGNCTACHKDAEKGNFEGH